MSKFIFDENDKEIFKDVAFLVEASHNEMHYLWEKYHYRPSSDHVFTEKWEQVSLGRIVTIGHLNKRPICVGVYYAIINNKRVAFYEGTSQLVDYKMIEDWLQHWTLKTIRWDNGGRWAHCDAMNFHHCLDAIGVIDEWRKKRNK